MFVSCVVFITSSVSDLILMLPCLSAGSVLSPNTTADQKKKKKTDRRALVPCSCHCDKSTVSILLARGRREPELSLYLLFLLSVCFTSQIWISEVLEPLPAAFMKVSSNVLKGKVLLFSLHMFSLLLSIMGAF